MPVSRHRLSQYRESFPQFSFIIFLISRLSSPDNTFRSIERTDGALRRIHRRPACVVGSFHLTRQCVLLEMGCDSRICRMRAIPSVASAFIREDADLLVQVRDKTSTDYGKISGDNSCPTSSISRILHWTISGIVRENLHGAQSISTSAFRYLV